MNMMTRLKEEDEQDHKHNEMNVVPEHPALSTSSERRARKNFSDSNPRNVDDVDMQMQSRLLLKQKVLSSAAHSRASSVERHDPSCVAPHHPVSPDTNSFVALAAEPNYMAPASSSSGIDQSATASNGMTMGKEPQTLYEMIPSFIEWGV